MKETFYKIGNRYYREVTDILGIYLYQEVISEVDYMEQQRKSWY